MYKSILSCAPLIGVLTALAFITPASSGSAQDLNIWKQETAQFISDNMSYLSRGPLHHDVLHEVDLLIDRQGNILKKSAVRGNGWKAHRRVSEKTIDELQSLPALPETFEDERALIRLYLVYANSDSGANRVLKQIRRRQGQVRIEELADSGTKLIEIAAN